MAVKKKRFLKTTTKKKDDKEIPYFYYCDKKYHLKELFQKKLKDFSLKDISSRKKIKNDNKDNEDSEFYCLWTLVINDNGSYIQEHQGT